MPPPPRWTHGERGVCKHCDGTGGTVLCRSLCNHGACGEQERYQTTLFLPRCCDASGTGPGPY